MKAIHEASHSGFVLETSSVGQVCVDDVRVGNERVARLYKEKSVGKTRSGHWDSLPVYMVGTSNAVIDFGVLNAALAVFPTRATAPLLAYNSAAVVLAATNSFVWNRCWVFLGRRLSTSLPAKTRGLPSSLDRASEDKSVQASLSIVSLKQRMEVVP